MATTNTFDSSKLGAGTTLANGGVLSYGPTQADGTRFETFTPATADTNQAIANRQHAEDFAAKNLGTNSPTSPVSSSANVRADVTDVKTNAANLASNIDSATGLMGNEIKNLMDRSVYADTAAGKTALSDLETIRKNLGIVTAGEQSAIEQAGQAAGLQFDPLIAQATEEKRRGMPKAVVQGGERGGFMNSQISGAAATSQTQGGTFVGAGGELENIKSVYDNNISQLQAKKQSAILAATAAAREAIISGRRQDLAAAQDAFKIASDAHNSAITLAKEKLDAISTYEKMQQARTEFNQGQAKLYMDQISTIVKTGGDIPTDISSKLDAAYGAGFSEKYKTVAQKANNAKDFSSQVDAAKDLYSILEKVPQGTEIKIGDHTYAGVGEDKNNQTFKEEDAYGNVTFVTVDKGTGKIVSTAQGGKIGTGKKTTGGSGVVEQPSSQPTKTFEEWVKEKSTKDKVTYDLGNAAIKSSLMNQYNAEVPKITTTKSPYSLKQLQSMITSTDKQEMIKKNLNVNNSSDIIKYINEKKGSSSIYSLVDSFINQ